MLEARPWGAPGTSSLLGAVPLSQDHKWREYKISFSPILIPPLKGEQGGVAPYIPHGEPEAQ